MSDPRTPANDTEPPVPANDNEPPDLKARFDAAVARAKEQYEATVSAAKEQFETASKAAAELVRQEVEIAKISALQGAHAVRDGVEGLIDDVKTHGPGTLKAVGPELAEAALQAATGIDTKGMLPETLKKEVQAEFEKHGQAMIGEVRFQTKIDSPSNLDVLAKEDAFQKAREPHLQNEEFKREHREGTEPIRAQDDLKIAKETALHEEHSWQLQVVVPPKTPSPVILDSLEERSLSASDVGDRAGFQRMSFEQQSSQLKAMFDRQDAEMATLQQNNTALDPDKRAGQVYGRQLMANETQAERYQATLTVCQSVVMQERGPEFDTRRESNRARLTGSNAPQAEVDASMARCETLIDKDLQTTAKVFHEQTFPEIARSGPYFSGAEVAAPAPRPPDPPPPAETGPGSSGPGGGF